jgi:predicted alpha-1,6-mannanase (GH76 family)
LIKAVSYIRNHSLSNMSKQIFYLSAITLMCALSACKENAFLTHCNYKVLPTGDNEKLNRAIAVETKLLNAQNINSLWKRAGWWNSANILESLIDFNCIAHQDFTKCLNNLYIKNVHVFRGHFIMGHSFDDNEWWGLVWLKAYDMTGDKRYLRVSKGIFNDMVKRAWDNKCDGGIRWADNIWYKNAITNELFMELAARLALEPADSVKRDYYLQWAIKDWNWIKNSGMINKDAMINDGLDNKCLNNGGFAWSYNQGVILGGLKDLYLLTGDSVYLKEAKTLANSSMKHLSNGRGILTEPGDNKPNHDKNQFKGIYIRYLAMLNIQLKDNNIKDFILSNADYTWQHARSAENWFDFYWGGPYLDWSSSAQGSVMDLMNAALMQ